MKKLSTILCTLALLFGAVGGMDSVKADPVKVALNQLKAGYGTDSDWLTIANGITYPIEVKDGTLFGSDGGTQTTNADVMDYDYLYVTVTDYSANKAVRIFFWDKNQSKRIDYYLKPETQKETANFEAPSDITGNGTYCVKIPDGARLQGAKPAWGSSADVTFKFSEIYLTARATPYVELEPYTLVFSDGTATIPISESHIRTTGNVSINYSTGVVTSTGSGKLIIYLKNEDLIGATRYVADVTDTDHLEPVLEVADAVNGEVGGIYGSRYNWNIAGDASRNTKIGAVTALRYNFSKSGSMTINSLRIEANELIAATTQKNLADMPYGSWGLPAHQVSNYISVDAYKTNNIGEGNKDLIYGHDGVGDVRKYVDLTNCTKIIFIGSSSNGQLRLFYNWDGTEGGKSTATIADFPTNSDTYEFDIEAFKKLNGINFFHLNGIKATYGQTANISAIKVVEYTNVISGSGIDRTKNYRLNPFVTSIDATGVTAATALTLANPNCLVVANAGKVTNEQNVIVDGTCTNLVLADGYPFKAPAAFTATAAKFTKAVGDAAYATMVVPFAVASLPTGVKAYNLNAANGEVITTEEVTSLTADKPVMVKAAADTYEFTASNVAVAATADDVVVNGLLRGVYATTAATADASNYVMQKNGNDVNFYLVTGTDATVKPFRAYLTTAVPSARMLTFNLDEATAIDAVNDSKKTSDGYYNLNGQRVAQPTKGLYIINGKKLIVR